MKKTSVRPILLLLIALLAVCPALLASCGGSAADAGTEAQTDANTAAETLPDLRFSGDEGAKYAIVRSENAPQDIVDAAMNLRTRIQSTEGTELQIRSDLINEKLGYTESEYEILIGSCDRTASREAAAGLLAEDFIILARGTKLVITGGSDAATVRAVSYFAGNLLQKDASFPQGEIYLSHAEYPLSSLKLNGTEISEFIIVSSHSNFRLAAEEIQSRISRLTGHVLPIVGKTETGSHEIQLGTCGRPLSDSLNAPEEVGYVYASDGANVALTAPGKLSARYGARAFLDQFLPADARGTLDVTLPNGAQTSPLTFGTPLAEGAEVRFISSNVLGNDTLKDRAAILTDLYLQYLPDVIGMQECNSTGHSEIITALREIYASVNTKITASGKTCYTPIMYRKDLYEAVASEAVLFDSRWPKTDTKTFAWVVLRNKKTGQSFAVINAHISLILSSYDTEAVFGKKMTDGVEGKLWRQDNSRQILETVEMLRQKYGASLPVTVMGDLNDYASSKSVGMLAEKLGNCIDLATVSATKNINSYHNNPGQRPSGTSAIDHMFVTTDTVSVFTHLIDTSDAGIRCSDHCPLICDLAFKK